MPRFGYHLATNADDPLPEPESLPSVMAASPDEAALLLTSQGRLPFAGEGLYLRLVAGDGTVTVFPFTPEFELPIDEPAPDDF